MSGLRLDPNVACTECGRFGAYAFEGEPLCLECYEGRGSCCAERTMWVEDDAPTCSPVIQEHN